MRQYIKRKHVSKCDILYIIIGSFLLDTIPFAKVNVSKEQSTKKQTFNIVKEVSGL